MNETSVRAKDEIPLVFDEDFLDLMDRGTRATIEISSDGRGFLISARNDEAPTTQNPRTAR